MDWLRLWHDMPNDPKWRAIAKRSNQKIGDVMSVYMHMMVNASENDPRGSIENWEDEDVAAALDIDQEGVEAIREAMQGKVLDGDRLKGWDKRQPSREDNSRERVRKHREKKAAKSKECNGEANAVAEEETTRNADVTQGNAPEKIRLDTDKETDKEQLQGSASCDASPADSEKPAGVRDFPTKDGKGFTASEKFIGEMKATYPRIDVEYQLQKARLWLIANDARQKTPRGMNRFLNNWMGNQKPTAEIHPIQSRHTGFEDRDYSAGLIEGVADDAANF